MRIGAILDDRSTEPEHEYHLLYETMKELRKRGHDTLRLSIQKAQMERGHLVYPDISSDPITDQLDAFITWSPGYRVIEEFSQTPEEGQSVSFYDQLRYLSDRLPSPTPYEAKVIGHDKGKMVEFFRSIAVPIPATCDGDDKDLREEFIKTHFNDAAQYNAVVAKPKYGWGGENVTIMETESDARYIFECFDDIDMPFVVQDFIEGYDADYRAFVVDDKIVASIKRQAAEGDWRGNFSQGASVSAHVLTPAQEQDALKIMRAANLAYGAVDILIDAETEEHYICEYNSFPGIESIETTHPGLKIAPLVVDMMEARYG